MAADWVYVTVSETEMENTVSQILRSTNSDFTRKQKSTEQQTSGPKEEKRDYIKRHRCEQSEQEVRPTKIRNEGCVPNHPCVLSFYTSNAWVRSQLQLCACKVQSKSVIKFNLHCWTLQVRWIVTILLT